MRNACYDMIAYAKQNNYTVIVSSSDATDHSLDYLQQGGLYQLARHLDRGGRCDGS